MTPHKARHLVVALWCRVAIDDCFGPFSVIHSMAIGVSVIMLHLWLTASCFFFLALAQIVLWKLGVLKTWGAQVLWYWVYVLVVRLCSILIQFAIIYSACPACACPIVFSFLSFEAWQKLIALLQDPFIPYLSNRNWYVKCSPSSSSNNCKLWWRPSIQQSLIIFAVWSQTLSINLKSLRMKASYISYDVGLVILEFLYFICLVIQRATWLKSKYLFIVFWWVSQ